VAGLEVGKSDPTFSKKTIKLDHEWIGMVRESKLNRASGFAPARLTLSAFNQQYHKFTKITEAVDDLVFRAFDLLRGVLERGIGPCHILSEQEGLEGKKDEDGILQPIDTSTSAGYLFSKRGKKRDWLEQNRSHWDEYCRIDFQSVCSQVPYSWIWRLSLKDEKRDVERVAANKTRVFCAAPFPVLITGRRCTGDFVRRFYHLQKSGSFVTTVGINVYGGGWHKLVQSLTDDFKIQTGYEGDVSGMDKSMGTWIIWHVGLLVASFYPEDDRNTILAHWSRYVHKLVVDLEGNIVWLDLGNPSGGPDTVVINTIVAIWANILAWLKLEPNLTVSQFLAICHDAIYGDDLFGFSRVMTYDTMEWAVNRMGFEFSGRDGVLENLSFLGRKTVLVGGYALPKLEANRVLGIMEWVRNEEPAAQLSRVLAAYVQSFPLLFTEDAEVFVVIRKYLMRLVERCSQSHDSELRAAARSIPSPYELGEFYTGFQNALRNEVFDKLIGADQLRCQEERK